MGFLMLEPELDDGRVKLTGLEETDEENAIVDFVDLWGKPR